MHWGKLLLASALIGFGVEAGVGAAEVNMDKATEQAGVRIERFVLEKPICRAGRPATLSAMLVNTADAAAEVRSSLTLPTGVKVVRSQAPARLQLKGREEKALTWTIEAERATHGDVVLEVRVGDRPALTQSLTMEFLPALQARKLPYIPEPEPARTQVLVGAHHCPLWEVDKPNMWANVHKHPERTPVLGFYNQENPEVSDWETKWAVEHGVNFFIYCWYRASQGEPVKMRYGSAIHDALFKAKHTSKMKFTIMWENQNRGTSGVADEKDLMENLLPFWMENYFKHPSYLKVDNKPVLFIYRPEYLIRDLGGEENVVKAFARMRQACKDAGFDGLTILGEYRGQDPKRLALMKQLGLDYTFAYCWPIPNHPTPERAIQTQMQYIRKTQEMGIIPQVVTVSQAWSGWRDEGSIWKIPPKDFEVLLRQAKEFIGTLPAEELGSRMLLLDNWNEWGEGHYIAPYREYGFGYLDAVRRVFSDAPEEHVDLIPEDIGMGPYDTAYKALQQHEEMVRKQAAKRVFKAGAPEPGLIGWWSFDEEKGNPLTFDYAGNGLGGGLRKAERAPGIDGSALVCNGGCAVVNNNPLLSVTTAVTVECWVKTDLANQPNNWLVNRILAGGVNTGYRLGLVGNKPSFAVPWTDWSHHVTAPTPLPLGRWVHLAGTFDGQVIRLYVDGEEQGAMERPGPIRPNTFPLHLGSYEAGHKAHFTGLLDEVRLYNRALSAEEVRARYRKWADRAGKAS